MSSRDFREVDTMRRLSKSHHCQCTDEEVNQAAMILLDKEVHRLQNTVNVLRKAIEETLYGNLQDPENVTLFKLKQALSETDDRNPPIG